VHAALRAADTRGDAAARWLALGERSLALGRPDEAAGLFERAARLDDDRPDAELGQLRAWLQAGDYAHAVAWGRLVAGEHAGWPVAAAWADAVEALARPARPADAGTPPLPAPPARRPRDATRASTFQAVGGGLIDGPSRQLRLAPSIRGRLVAAAAAGPLWVADGTGALLRLADDLETLGIDDPSADAPPGLRGLAPVRAPAVPGRPVLVMSVLPDGTRPDACGAGWPRLRTGLLALPLSADPRWRIDLPGPRAPDGSPVWDACGQWLGWIEGGVLEPAPVPVPVPSPISVAAPAACASRAGLDVAAHYGHWYAAAATVWRAD
jgi:hypothetical protein